MKIYKCRLIISTHNKVCSQRQVPPQTKSTTTLGQHKPQKLTQKKTQTVLINPGSVDKDEEKEEVGGGDVHYVTNGL